ncbi:MAG: hypothetical protein AB1505_25380 [Candidatus Latescibacterota bacterium]
MSRALPPRPHLDSLRKQARQLCRGLQAADPEALRRIRDSMPQLRRASDAEIAAQGLSLQSAQCVLAREYGFANWAELCRAVDILRQAGPAMVQETDEALARGQSLHVLVPERVAAEAHERLAAHCGGDRVLRIERWVEHGGRIPRDALLAALAPAPVVVSPPNALAFEIMYERLEAPAGPHPLAGLLGQCRAFVNVPAGDERTPLIISGPDGKGGARDLISMYLTEFYGLYGSMADHRY